MKLTTIAIALAAVAVTTGTGHSQTENVIINGDFENNPPPVDGNNIGWSIAPWTLGPGQNSNVVKVDGPGGYNYGSSGPESDADAPGAGTDQHYLDIANGSNSFFQSFTPECSGPLDFGGSFSTRQNAPGNATISLRLGSGLSGMIVATSSTITLPGGNSMTDEWMDLSFVASVDATTVYSFVVEMDNNLNFDNAFAIYQTNCQTVGVNKDLQNNTGQPADCIEILLEGVHSGFQHYDGYSGNRFATYTEMPAAGGNTRLSWSNPNNDVQPGQIAHVGFNLPGTEITILGVFWSRGGGPTGCAHQVSTNTHLWGTSGSQVFYENDCLTCESVPRFVGDLVLEWYTSEVPLADLNRFAIRPPIRTDVIGHAPLLLMPGGTASVSIPEPPAGATHGVVTHKVSGDASLAGPDVTIDFLQFDVLPNQILGGDECVGAVSVLDAMPAEFDTTLASVSDPVWPCAGAGGPDRWYVYTPTSPTSFIEASTCGSDFDTALELFTGTCGNLVPLECNDDACGLQSTVTVPSPGAGTAIYVRVGGFNGATGTGTLVITEMGDPCVALGDDGFEDNDDCSSAVPVTDGAWSDLVISGADNDFFAVQVADGDTFSVEALFIDAEMDMDLYLWDPAVACDTTVVGEGTGTGALAVGFTGSDNEIVTYTNTTGMCQSLIVEITRFDGNTSGPGCANYDLVISGSNGESCGGGIGTNYCMANPNSTGGTASISATGSSLVANNNVTLESSGLPANASTFFITSRVQGFVPNPAGSQGNLCLGGAVGRYVGPGQIKNSGATGSATLTLDLTVTPQPAGSVSVMVGESWNYQGWYRDSVGGVPASNFTDGYFVDFQ